MFHCRIKDVYLSATLGFLLLDFWFNNWPYFGNHNEALQFCKTGGCDAFKCFQASDFCTASCWWQNWRIIQVEEQDKRRACFNTITWQDFRIYGRRKMRAARGKGECCQPGGCRSLTEKKSCLLLCWAVCSALQWRKSPAEIPSLAGDTSQHSASRAYYSFFLLAWLPKFSKDWCLTNCAFREDLEGWFAST